MLVYVMAASPWTKLNGTARTGFKMGNFEYWKFRKMKNIVDPTLHPVMGISTQFGLIPRTEGKESCSGEAAPQGLL